MSLLIKNGEIVTATERYKADIYCEDEQITAIGEDLEMDADEVIDASGQFIFPGFIDPHVHIYLPFMGTFSKDDYETASKAALIGGTTTLIEMCCPSREEEPLAAFQLWNSKAEGLSACDYTFHMGVTRYHDLAEAQLRTIVADYGITSFKVFLAYKGAFGIDDAELYSTLTLAKELGVVVTAHCENADLVAQTQATLVAEGKVGPEWHEPSRPVTVEAEGCHHLMTFAEMTGAEVYVVHTSCKPAVEAITAARERGVNATIETVIPYLVLDSSYAERANFEGAKYVMSPPLRAKEHQDFLWEKLADGTIDTVGTDHAPFDFATQKHMGHPEPDKAVNADGSHKSEPANFTDIPNGIPSVEDRINLLYTYGVTTGKIDLHTFVATASTNAAKRFGLFPRKGAVEVGSDADLVIYDPNYTGTISAETHAMNTDYSGFEGMEIKGRPSLVTVRGQVAARNGEFTGTPGRGHLLKRTHQ